MSSDRVYIVRSIAAQHLALLMHIDTGKAYRIAMRIRDFYYSVNPNRDYVGSLVINGWPEPLKIVAHMDQEVYNRIKSMNGPSKIAPAAAFLISRVPELEWMNIALTGKPCE